MPTEPITGNCLKCGRNVAELYAKAKPNMVFNCPYCHIGLVQRKGTFRRWDPKKNKHTTVTAYTLDFP